MKRRRRKSLKKGIDLGVEVFWGNRTQNREKGEGDTLLRSIKGSLS